MIRRARGSTGRAVGRWAAKPAGSPSPHWLAILDGLWSIKNQDLGGLTYPVTYTKDQKAPEPWR